MSTLSSSPKSTPGRKRGAAWEKRRTRIVREAAQLFGTQGYADTTMREIADAADVQKATLYHYFESKSDLLVRIHNDFMMLLFDGLEAIPEDASPQERLREVVFAIAGLMKTHRDYARTFFEHHRELPPGPQRELASRRELYQDAVVGMVADLMAAQPTTRRRDPRIVAMTILGAYNWAYHWYGRDGETRDHEEVAAEMWGVFADELVPGAASTPSPS